LIFFFISVGHWRPINHQRGRFTPAYVTAINAKLRKENVIACVNDTSNQMPPASLSPVVHFELSVSL
jgi:hypothetical protein